MPQCHRKKKKYLKKNISSINALVFPSAFPSGTIVGMLAGPAQTRAAAMACEGQMSPSVVS